ncbi:MAG: ATPase, partial [Spirochaetia bacterium]|nr:ATPase [Spirochaetia bacterium]
MGGDSPSNAAQAATSAVTEAWHARTIEESLVRLVSAADGLTHDDAAQRLLQYGPNELPAGRKTSPWALLVRQFQNVLIVILLIGAGLSVLMGHGTEAIVISVIVVFAAALGFVQEFRAEKAMDALRKMSAPNAEVIRSGEPVTLPARDLVPGDVICLHPGDRVPADGRLLEAVNLRSDEAPLTGESIAVSKMTGALPTGLSLADRQNMV